MSRDVWYYVNTPVNQALVAAIARGAVAPPRALWREGQPPAVIPERPNVFRLYQQNVGPLTPLIADHLVRALETWPVEWIEDAVAESVSGYKRSWRYIRGTDPGRLAGRGTRTARAVRLARSSRECYEELR